MLVWKPNVWKRAAFALGGPRALGTLFHLNTESQELASGEGLQIPASRPVPGGTSFLSGACSPGDHGVVLLFACFLP